MFGLLAEGGRLEENGDGLRNEILYARLVCLYIFFPEIHILVSLSSLALLLYSVLCQQMVIMQHYIEVSSRRRQETGNSKRYMGKGGGYM